MSVSPSAARTSARVLLPTTTASPAPCVGITRASSGDTTALGIVDVPGVTHPATHNTDASAMPMRNDLSIHVLEHEQRVVRPARVAERRVIRAVDEHLAVAAVEVGRRHGVTGDSRIELIDRQDFPAAPRD